MFKNLISDEMISLAREQMKPYEQRLEALEAAIARLEADMGRALEGIAALGATLSRVAARQPDGEAFAQRFERIENRLNEAAHIRKVVSGQIAEITTAFESMAARFATARDTQGELAAQIAEIRDGVSRLAAQKDGK